MTNKKKNQNQPQISSFFRPVATTSSSFVAQSIRQVSLANPTKVLADSSNTPQKKKQKFESIPVKPIVFDIDSLVRLYSSDSDSSL